MTISIWTALIYVIIAYIAGLGMSLICSIIGFTEYCHKLYTSRKAENKKHGTPKADRAETGGK